MEQQENRYSQTIENILQAMSDITNAQAKTLSFDKTIKAIIIDASQSNRGTYQVSQIGAENTNIFTAHSDNTSYQKNDCVYITVPEGDMASGNKIIIGKYVDDNESYYNYVNPMDGFLNITGNLIDNLDQKQWELTANYEDLSDIVVWSSYNLTLRGYDRLALSGQFKTWLSSSDINSGTYGLVLIVEDSSGKFTTFKLTTKEMYGNPYYYETFYLQEILVDISSIEEIRSLHLAVVQRNDFYKSNGEKASGIDDKKKRAPSNIFMKAPSIAVGYDVSNFTGDDLRIFTEDEMTFNSQEPSEQRTIKANWIHVPEGRSAMIVDDVAKMPKNPDYNNTTANDKFFPAPLTKADLVWFEYKTDYPGAHFAAGQGWVEVEGIENEFTYTFNTPAEDSSDGAANNLPYVKYKAMIMTPSLRYVNFTFKSTDQYEAIKECKDQAHKNIYDECLAIFHEVMSGEKNLSDGRNEINAKYVGLTSDDHSNFNTALNAYLNMRSEITWVDSGELTFPNTGYAPGKYAQGAIANLRIDVDPEYLKGSYLLYDSAGFIIDATEASQERYCEAVYETIAAVINQEGTTVEDIAYEVDSTESITWYIPIENTMIAYPTLGKEYYAGDSYAAECTINAANPDGTVPHGKYFKISRVPQFDETTIDEELLLAEHHMFARQYFKIKDYYTQLETNNKIYCRISKGGYNWYAVGNLEFGVAGTNGTDSTFTLKMYEVNADDSCSTVETSVLSLSTTFYEVDKDNNTVSLSEPKAGKVMIVPKLYDYNKKELTNHFTSTNITYKFFPYETNESLPFKLDRVNGDGSVLLRWNTAYNGYSLDKLNEATDYYLVLEAEVEYQITYNFLVYTDTTDVNDPTYLSPELKELGKNIGDYILDDEGNKQPALDENDNPITRSDYLKTYLPISIVKNKIQQYKVTPPDPSEAARPGAGAEAPDMSTYLKQMLGANKVVYDRNGSNAKYYKDPYKLFYEDSTEVTDISWSTKIKAVDEVADDEKLTVASFYPSLTAENILQPLEMYMFGPEIIANFCVIGKKNNEVICVQPVLIMQNKYGSTMLNKWDGSLTIDEKNGTILASMVGAGIKDRNNTFSGVLMGEVAQAFKDNHNGLGLYGFHESDQSFGFNVNGKAFIGKSGHGRIWFDGNTGTISSGTYSDGISEKYKIIGSNEIRPQQGMEIDLDGQNGFSSSLKMFGPAGGFVVDTTGIPMDVYGRAQETEEEQSIVFKLFTGAYEKESERGMIYFDNDGQYIQSTNYDGYYNYTVEESGKITSTHADRLKPLTGLTVLSDLRNLKDTGIKFDKYPKGLNGQGIPPGWIEESRIGSDNPSYNDHPATQGAFIDLQNGWVDMRNGIIGGWQLGQYSLTSPQHEIILWAGDPTSNDPIKKVPYIRIGAVNGAEMLGNIWIADYKVIGSTVSATDDDALAVSTVAWSNSSLNATGYDGFGDSEGNTVGTVEQLENIQTATLNEGTFSTRALNSWALKDDTDTNKDLNLGVVLETATSDKAEDGSIIIWRPSWTSGKKVSASLGTMDRPWSSVFVDGGFFMLESYTKFGGGNSTGWHLVATQDWVSQVIVAALNQRIKDVNNLASKALGTANTAVKKANDAISDILNWAATFNGRQFVTDFVVVKRDNGTFLSYNLTTVTAQADPKTGTLTGKVDAAVEKEDTPFTGYKITMGTNHSGQALYGTSVTMSWDDTSSIAHAINQTRGGVYNHAHAAEISCSGGALSCKTSPTNKSTEPSACTIFSSSGVDISESSGTITIKVTVADQEASDSFNMASTKFYKDAVGAAYNNGVADGKKAAACSKKHAGDTRVVNGVTQTLTWV